MNRNAHRGSDPQGDRRLELAAETARVDIADVVTGRVRAAVRTEEIPHRVEVDLRSTDVTVERVEIDRMLEPGEPVPTERRDGDTTIIPILEEVAVVETRIMLKAELRLTRTTRTETHQADIGLRRQQVEVRRDET